MQTCHIQDLAGRENRVRGPCDRETSLCDQRRDAGDAAGIDDSIRNHERRHSPAQLMVAHRVREPLSESSGEARLVERDHARSIDEFVVRQGESRVKLCESEEDGELGTNQPVTCYLPGLNCILVGKTDFLGP